MKELIALKDRLHKARHELAKEGRTFECDLLYSRIEDVESVQSMLRDEDDTLENLVKEALEVV